MERYISRILSAAVVAGVLLGAGCKRNETVTSSATSQTDGASRLFDTVSRTRQGNAI